MNTTNQTYSSTTEIVSNSNETISNQTGILNDRDRGLWRDLVAYWMLGLCNNYGYVIMLTAAYDILKELDENDRNFRFKVSSQDESRYCNLMSTGTILLANTIPSIIVKFSVPFLPFMIRLRVVVSCIAVAVSLVLVAFAQTQWVALLGVAFSSMSIELGETSFLAYSANFNQNVISSWSSGTGGAGVVGSFSYTLLRLVFNKQQTLLVMLIVPCLEILIFFFLLRKPLPMNQQIENAKKMNQEQDEIESDLKPLVGFREKVFYVRNLLIYLLPLTIVFLCEYFINQGLFELVYFPESFISRDEQYRWYQVTYQIGVFISRSTVNLIQIRQIWLLSFLQTLNVVYFMFESIFAFTPSIWIVFGVILLEGLIGGAAYVNTYFTRISKEIPLIHREFAMSVTAISGSGGVALAGFLSIPTHNWICGLPAPPRLNVS